MGEVQKQLTLLLLFQPPMCKVELSSHVNMRSPSKFNLTPVIRQLNGAEQEEKFLISPITNCWRA